uniref:SERPIN domain-containing protein n=1 Tax=Steinernema glaseri TaxID=37863 RepID=A0A1I7ZET3_9BILA
MGCPLTKLPDGTFLEHLSKKTKDEFEDPDRQDSKNQERRHYSSVCQSEDRFLIPFQDPLGVMFSMEGLDHVETLQSENEY